MSVLDTLPPVLNVLNNGMSNGLNTSNKQMFFQIIVIIVLIFIIFTYLFPTKYVYIIILILFAFYIGNLYVISNNTNVSNKNNTIMFHLNSLQEIVDEYIDNKINSSYGNSKLSKKQINEIYNKNQLDSLYIDSNLIEFLYSIKILYKWNPNDFYLLLKGSNNILRLKKEIEEYYESNKKYPDNINQMMETALILRSNTINNLHRFIFVVPKTHKMYEYINSIIKRYMILISRTTDKIYLYTKENIHQTGITTESNLALTYNTTKPYDPIETDFYI